MNKRIKQLAEQAGIAVWGDAVYMYDPKDTLDSTVMEKFAELIVRECGVVAYKTYCQTPGVLGIQYKQAIEEHFGVE
jgi:hypothetical protein